MDIRGMRRKSGSYKFPWMVQFVVGAPYIKFPLEVTPSLYPSILPMIDDAASNETDSKHKEHKESAEATVRRGTKTLLLGLRTVFLADTSEVPYLTEPVRRFSGTDL